MINYSKYIEYLRFLQVICTLLENFFVTYCAKTLELISLF
ncbi:hypothetical protein JOC76_000470 [Neobacillus cucumis]|nr:hypothetical protein [Neobacillus cucumis]